MNNTSDKYEPIPDLVHSLDGWQDIEIVENDETLLPLSHLQRKSRITLEPQYYLQGIEGALPECYFRKSAALKLVEASNKLPAGYSLVVWDAWRPLQVQSELYSSFVARLRKQYPDLVQAELEKIAKTYVTYPSPDRSHPPPHLVGGAIDLSIVSESGEYLGMGTQFDDFTEASHTRYYEERSEEISENDEEHDYMVNRRMLYHIMTSVEFTNYPNEWWHFDYGNQFWAASSGNELAYYGVYEP